MARIVGTLHVVQYTSMIIPRSFLLRMVKISHKSCGENHKTQFRFNKFSEKRAVYEITWKNMVQPDGLQMIIRLMRMCILDTYGYNHTLRICNTYCFSTATMVARKRLNIMSYVQCPSYSTLERYPPCKFTVHLEGIQGSFYN